MTIRRRDFIGNEVLTEANLEAYCQDNGVIQCDYYSELTSLPASVNAAWVNETKSLYVRTATGFKIMAFKDYVDTANAGQNTLISGLSTSLGTVTATANSALSIANNANNSLSAKPQVTYNGTGGTNSLKIYHRSYVTTLGPGPFVYSARCPLPSGAFDKYVQVSGNVGDSVQELERGTSLSIWKIEGNEVYFLWYPPLTVAEGVYTYGNAGASVRINYTAFYV